MLLDAGECGDRDRDERERQREADEQVAGEEVGPVRRVDGDLRVPEHSGVIATKPTAITIFAPIRVTSACATPAQTTAEPAVATNVTPVLSADQPSTFCTYSVRMKKFAKTTAPSSSPATFAPATVRTRKMRNGISGSLHARLDHEEDAEQHERGGDAARTSSRSVQPWSGAFETA